MTTALMAMAGAMQCGGATESLTQIVVIVDSDLRFPIEADRISVEANDGKGHVFERSKPIEGTNTLPMTFVASAQSETTSIVVTATATLGGKKVLSRSLKTSFVKGESRSIPLTLCNVCRGVTCGSDEQTCGESGTCVNHEAPADAVWNGTLGAPRQACGRSMIADAGLDAPPVTTTPDAALGGRCEGVGDSGRTVRVPVRAFIASNTAFNHVCNPDNVLKEDNVTTGLDYASGGNDETHVGDSLKIIGGRLLPGCIGVDFGVVGNYDQIMVRARAVRQDTVCQPPSCQKVLAPNTCTNCCSTCSNDLAQDGFPFCTHGGVMLVFAGTEEGVYTQVQTANTLGSAFQTFPFSVLKPTRYIVVCRSSDGPATGDVEIDSITSDTCK